MAYKAAIANQVNQKLWVKRAGVLGLALLLALACMVFTGCDQQKASEESPEQVQKKTTLVAYYSATGHTREVAEAIARNVDADLLELVPVEPYNEHDLDYDNDESRVAKEHRDPALQNVELVSVTPDNFDQYETVFIGYPIWWGDAAWPINSFVKDNDFTGKTVVPFCTSASSPLGQSAANLHALNETGNWLEGVRLPQNATQDEVDEWLTTLVMPLDTGALEEE